MKRPISGFTLVELVLVLAIITIVALAAVPTFSAFAKGRVVEDTAARFVSAAHYARAQAISDGVTYRMNIDAQGNKWWLTMDDGNAFVDVDASVAPPVTLAEGMRMQSNAPVVENVQVIEFDSGGRSDPATVTFTGPAGDVATVACDTPIDTFHVVTTAGVKR